MLKKWTRRAVAYREAFLMAQYVLTQRRPPERDVAQRHAADLKDVFDETAKKLDATFTWKEETLQIGDLHTSKNPIKRIRQNINAYSSHTVEFELNLASLAISMDHLLFDSDEGPGTDVSACLTMPAISGIQGFLHVLNTVQEFSLNFQIGENPVFTFEIPGPVDFWMRRPTDMIWKNYREAVGTHVAHSIHMTRMNHTIPFLMEHADRLMQSALGAARPETSPENGPGAPRATP